MRTYTDSGTSASADWDNATVTTNATQDWSMRVGGKTVTYDANSGLTYHAGKVVSRIAGYLLVALCEDGRPQRESTWHFQSVAQTGMRPVYWMALMALGALKQAFGIGAIIRTPEGIERFYTHEELAALARCA